MVPARENLRLNVSYPHKSQAQSHLNWLLFLLLWRNTYKKQLLEEGVYFGSWFESTVHQGREGFTAGAGASGSWPGSGGRGLLVCCSLLSPVSAQDPGPWDGAVRIWGGWVSTSVNSPWEHPHRRAQRCDV